MLNVLQQIQNFTKISKIVNMHYLLFTTTTCPKCPKFKEFIANFLKIPGKTIDERDEQFQTLSRELLVNSVPTLFVFEDEGYENALLRTDDASEIYDFINKK